jgi:hypothetical protein
MSINSTIIGALKPLNIPVVFHNYSGTATTYITFFTVSQRTLLNADDEEYATTYTIQIDVSSKGNLDPTVQSVKDYLKPLGFTRRNEMDLYNSTSSTYRKMLTFGYTEYH